MPRIDGAIVRDYLEAHSQQMVRLLEKLVRAESPSTVAKAQLGILRILKCELEEVEARVEILAGERSGGHLLALCDAHVLNGTQLLVGHCDTVWPLGTLKEMPFLRSDGRISGPGVFDMKGGLVEIVFALRALRDAGYAPVFRPLVFVNSDEEIGSPDSTRHIERLARSARRALVLEAALGPAGDLKIRRKGGGRFIVTVTGKAAHAGMGPEGGASAILELSHVIQKLHALNNPERGVTVNVGVIEGGIRPNMIAPKSRAFVDARVERLDDAPAVERAIRSIRASTRGVSLSVAGGIARGPMEATPGNLALMATARRLGRELSLDLSESMAGGMSDANTTSLYTPTLDGLGPIGDGAHAHHEFIYEHSLVERAALLALLLATPTDPPESQAVVGASRLAGATSLG